MKLQIKVFWSAMFMVLPLLLSAEALAAGRVTADEVANFTVGDGAAALELLTGGDSTRASWDSDGKTLTLSGVDFSSSAATAVLVPDGTTLVLEDGTENRIQSTCEVQYAYSLAIACGTGDNMWSEEGDEYAFWANLNGDLTIRGGGELSLRGGTIHAQTKGLKTAGLGADNIVIEDGEITATGGTAENGAYSTGIYSESRGSVQVNGGTVNASGGSVGIWTYQGELSIAEGATVYAYGNSTGISGSTVNVSGGQLTAEGNWGISAHLNVSGGKVIADGTQAGTYQFSGTGSITGGTVILRGKILGGGFFPYSSFTISGGDIISDGTLWFYRLTANGGRLSVRATQNFPAVGLRCTSKTYPEPSEEGMLVLGDGMALRYKDTDGAYEKTAVPGDAVYDFYEDYGQFNKSYSALFEEDGTSFAADVKIAPEVMFQTATVESTKEQIEALTSDSDAASVNMAADSFASLSEEEQAGISDTEISTLDTLVKEKNQVAVTVDTAGAPTVRSVSGLAMATGVTENLSVKAVALTVTNVTDTKEASEADALLELDFHMTVDGEAAQPVSPVLISVSYTEAMRNQGEDLRVVHVNEDGSTEQVSYTVSGDSLTFRANQFSSYAIVGDVKNTPVEKLTFLSTYRVQTPETLDGKGTLIVAGYDADGRMTEVLRYDLVEANQIKLLSWSGHPASCRAFLLTQDGRPMAVQGSYAGN